jgi:hypothetical protein
MASPQNVPTPEDDDDSGESVISTPLPERVSRALENIKSRKTVCEELNEILKLEWTLLEKHNFLHKTVEDSSNIIS